MNNVRTDMLCNALSLMLDVFANPMGNIRSDEARAVEYARKALASSAAPSSGESADGLSVTLSEMRESNGRSTWDVRLTRSGDSLLDSHSVYTDTIKGRAEYEADSLKHFLGLGPLPDMLAYDTDAPAAHSSAPSEAILALNCTNEQADMHQSPLSFRAGFHAGLAAAAALAPTGESLPVQGVPEGWKLVPVESTSEMDNAGWHAIGDMHQALDAERCYSAMLAAAPAPTGASK